jgi:hypothetical protein
MNRGNGAQEVSRKEPQKAHEAHSGRGNGMESREYGVRGRTQLCRLFAYFAWFAVALPQDVTLRKPRTKRNSRTLRKPYSLASIR